MSEGITRHRRRLGSVDEACTLCGHQGLELVESRRARQLPRFWEKPHARRYKLCAACGAHHPV